ncbi:unnamed protein product, partial [Rotaria magnacalcarata]
MPPVYANDRLIAYALANDPTFVFIHNSSVELHTDHNRLGEAKIDCIPQHNQPSPTPTVDEKEITKKRIIELSLKYQILSPHTAFIGVEKRVNSSNADMVLREVPIQISAGDEHLFEFQQKMDFCAPTIQYCAMPPSALRASMNQSNLS